MESGCEDSGAGSRSCQCGHLIHLRVTGVENACRTVASGQVW